MSLLPFFSPDLETWIALCYLAVVGDMNSFLWIDFLMASIANSHSGLSLSLLPEFNMV